MLNELSEVDYTVLSEEPSAVKIIKNLKPDYYVKGPDYKVDTNDKAGNLKIEKKKLKNMVENSSLHQENYFHQQSFKFKF